MLFIMFSFAVLCVFLVFITITRHLKEGKNDVNKETTTTRTDKHRI